MRHRIKTPKLGRTMEHRKAMLKNLATSILLKGLQEEQLQRHVVTTLQKAKAVRSLVERLITYGKKGDLSAKRLAVKHVKDKKAFQGLFEVLAERYKDRNGGYTRILKLSSNRHGDNAQMAIISLVEDEVTPKPKKKKKKASSKSAKPSAKKEAAKPVAKKEAAEQAAEPEAPKTEEKAEVKEVKAKAPKAEKAETAAPEKKEAAKAKPAKKAPAKKAASEKAEAKEKEKPAKAEKKEEKAVEKPEDKKE